MRALAGRSKAVTNSVVCENVFDSVVGLCDPTVENKAQQSARVAKCGHWENVDRVSVEDARRLSLTKDEHDTNR